MLKRTALILTIVASFAVCAINAVKVKRHIQLLRSDLQQQTVARQSAEKDLASTISNLQQTTLALNQARKQVESATAANEKARDEIAVQNQRLVKLNRQLGECGDKLEGTQEQLARFQATGLKPEEIVQAASQISNLQTALQKAEALNKKLIARLPVGDLSLPANLTGTVVVMDPKWNFVVVDAGEEQGVLADRELLVNRHGILVAKLRISRVEKNRCVANIVPGWSLAEIMEGDQVVPAHPRS